MATDKWAWHHQINMQCKQTEWFWYNQLKYDTANLRNYYTTAYLHNWSPQTNVIISDYVNLFVKTRWNSTTRVLLLKGNHTPRYILTLHVTSVTGSDESKQKFASPCFSVSNAADANTPLIKWSVCCAFFSLCDSQLIPVPSHVTVTDGLLKLI